MRTINCWDDIEQFGIKPLTGEACGYAMRLLCDVTPEGKSLIQSFLGGNVEIKPGSNWNGGSGDNPHVGSVLLARSMLTDLGAFALLKTGTAIVVALHDGTVCEMDQERFAQYNTLDTGAYERWLATDQKTPVPEMLIKRTWRRSSDPGTGDRNTHAFSGRTE